MRFAYISFRSIFKNNDENNPFGTEEIALIARIRALFIHIYASEEFERYQGKKTINPDSDSISAYNFINWQFLLLSFIGFPNKNLSGRVEDELNVTAFLLNLFKNLVGWRENSSTLGLLFAAPIMIPLNLISLPVKFLVNVVKLVTEFLPALTVLAADLVFSKFGADFFLNFSIAYLEYQGTIKFYKESNLLEKTYNGLKFVLQLAILVLTAIVFLTGLISYFLGSLITSPYDLFKAVDKNTLIKQDQIVFKWCLKIMIIFAAGILYTLMAPYVAKFLIKPLFATIAQHLPSALIAIGDFLTKYLGSVFKGLGQGVNYPVKEFLSMLTLGKVSFLTSQPIASGLGFFIGVMSVPMTQLKAMLVEVVFSHWAKLIRANTVSSTVEGSLVIEDSPQLIPRRTRAQKSSQTAAKNTSPQSLSSEGSKRIKNRECCCGNFISTFFYNNSSNLSDNTSKFKLEDNSFKN